ncbi:RNA 2'-phosphotransferase [Sedimenticola sp.]|uniref:RNA 2'-phosphotransferase n=1 Tax=Sedimenticola sp. TaxID=1940285 RepID=UPI003D111211
MNKTQQDLTKTSKFLSFVLRHKPEAIGLKLDPQGWADIDELIAKANQSGEMTTLDRGLIEMTVESNDKKRFVISEDGKCIRASQGHSVNVDLQLTPKQPPDVLYHGTASRFLESIKAEGLKPGQRQYVHLSGDTDTAVQVGKRYGKPVVLIIDAKAMYQQGMEFFQAENDVWLTPYVAPKFIKTD